MTMADQIVVMQAGRLMQQGTPDEIYSQPADRFTADFIGRMNWLEAERDPAGAIRLLAGAVLPRAAPCSGARYSVGVRPERITLAPADGDIAVPATVRTVENLGPDLHVRAALADGGTVLVSIKNTGSARPVAGQQLRLGFAPDSCIVLPDPASR